MKLRIAVLLATLSLILTASRAQATAPAVSFPISVSSAFSNANWIPHAEACTTGLQGTAYIVYANYAGCSPIYDANENFLGHVDTSGTTSALAALAAIHSPVSLDTSLGFLANTAPGQANYGLDSGEVLYQGPNLPAISTTGMWNDTIDCDTSVASYAVYTCNTATGHGINGLSIFYPVGAKYQGNNTDQHNGTIGIPCVAYTDARGCERYTWLNQQEPNATTGTVIHVGGGGECPLGPTVADGTDAGDAYFCEGATASYMPVGATNINAAELADAMLTGGYIHHAIAVAALATQSGPVYPSYGSDSSVTNAPHNGARWFYQPSDAQTTALGLRKAETVILKTIHHYGFFITDTTGGYGPGFNPQSNGCSGFTLNLSGHNDPCATMFGLEGASDLTSLVWTGADFPDNLKQCVYGGIVNHNYTGATKPATC